MNIFDGHVNINSSKATTAVSDESLKLKIHEYKRSVHSSFKLGN